MVFSSPITGFRCAAMAAAGIVCTALFTVPEASHAHELKASIAATQPSTQGLQAQKRVGSEWKEIRRDNAYSPTVWMPEAASGKFAGSDVSFGLARLNPLVRRGFGLTGSGVEALAPVMALQVSPTSSVTLIKVVGDSSSAMIAWQLKL